ncbi:S-2-hydroxy-acid oxidase [Polychaeton citri CBS 116435]|uniref:S-2-hydroxy-acid oxidase n=1 Tax=Polychaeton citri CBS 116435 TaxID=1314669 RepID=A0A9P4QEE5_9PEZI|nr:S-2-hydroxy-acid oxidase [Polychaeton citri CBS 116435]
MTKEQTQEREDPITIAEVEEIARRRLPKNVYEYYACGSDNQEAVHRNDEAFRRVFVIPRVLRDVSKVDTSTQVFGTTYALPIGIAPSAMHRLVGGEGEMDVGRASANLNINMTLSSQSTTSLEDVAGVLRKSRQVGLPSPKLWFQIYLNQDLDNSVPLIKRAEAAGYEALVLTVDTPVLGNRLNERKTPLVLPPHLRLANIETKPDPNKRRKPTVNRLLMDARTAKQANELLQQAGDSMHSSSLTWETTLKSLRQITKMKVILKGIMAPEDARLAVEHGADAIVVSNHGGRQLDCTTSTIEALPDVADAVQGRLPVIFDGGVRHGSDVFKALALGADFVLVGRPALWGLAYNGCDGVESVMNILERELSRTMALAGVTKVQDINRSMIGVARHNFGVARL